MNHAAPKARPSARKRYALAFGVPTACSRNGTPTAMRTAPPSTPRLAGAGRMVGELIGRRSSRRYLTRCESAGRVTLQALGVLEAAAGVEHGNALAVRDPAIGSQARGGGERSATLGTHEHPL